MRGYYFIDAPIYGSLGPDTAMDTSHLPPVLKRLHYLLDSQPECDLFKGPRCYLVSRRLGEALKASKLSGYQLGDASIAASKAMLQLHPRAKVESALWLRVTGKPQADDFSLDEFFRLVVSEKALKLLRSFDLEACNIYEIDKASTPEQVAQKIFDTARQRSGDIKKRK